MGYFLITSSLALVDSGILDLCFLFSCTDSLKILVIVFRGLEYILKTAILHIADTSVFQLS